MSWIERVGYEASTGRLRAIYDRIKGPRGELDGRVPTVLEKSDGIGSSAT